MVLYLTQCKNCVKVNVKNIEICQYENHIITIHFAVRKSHFKVSIIQT